MASLSLFFFFFFFLLHYFQEIFLWQAPCFIFKKTIGNLPKYLVTSHTHPCAFSFFFCVSVSCFDFTAFTFSFVSISSYLDQSIIHQSKKGKDEKVGV